MARSRSKEAQDAPETVRCPVCNQDAECGELGHVLDHRAPNGEVCPGTGRRPDGE